jgi:hypothetical protein
MNKPNEEEKDLHATHQGKLKIGDIDVAVLNNRERVVSVRGLSNALGTKGGGSYWKLKKAATEEEKAILPEFVSVKNLEPYLGDIETELIKDTVQYKALNGQEATGVRAEVIPKICDIWVRALKEGRLTSKQQIVAEKAYVLLSAFATVGITALIDEATGFQKEKDEYQKILEKYIAKELQPWIKMFGEDYYYQIYRLKGWDWNRFAVDRKNHPWAVGNITNRIVYEKLPEGVIGELMKLEPRDEKGHRKHKLHQHLTGNAGQIHLLKHLGAVVNIMERHKDGDWESALHEIDTRFPSKRIGKQATLDLKYEVPDKTVFDGVIARAAKPLPREKGK